LVIGETSIDCAGFNEISEAFYEGQWVFNMFQNISHNYYIEIGLVKLGYILHEIRRASSPWTRVYGETFVTNISKVVE